MEGLLPEEQQQQQNKRREPDPDTEEVQVLHLVHASATAGLDLDQAVSIISVICSTFLVAAPQSSYIEISNIHLCINI